MNKEAVIRNHKFLTFLGIVTLLLVVAIIFADVIFRFAGNTIANKVQDDFKIKISDVDTEFIGATFALKVDDRKTGKQIFYTPEMKVDLGFSGIQPVVNLNLKDGDVTISKDFLTRKAQASSSTEKEKKETDFGVLSYLGVIEVLNSTFEISDAQKSFLVSLQKFYLNFPAGQGDLQGLTAELPYRDYRLASVNEVTMKFDSQGLAENKDGEIGITVKDTRIKLAKTVLKELSELFKMPEDKPKKQEGQPLLKHLSFIDIEDTEVDLEDYRLETELDSMMLNFAEGKFVMEDTRALWKPENDKLFSINKFSASFSPDDFIQGSTPDVKAIVTGADFRLTKKLKRFAQKQEEPSKEPSALPFTLKQLLVGNTEISFPEYPGVGKQKFLRIEEIFGHIDNVSLRPHTPLSRFTFNATLEGESRMMTDGRFDLAHSPPRISADFEVFNFDMTKLNKELRKRIPLTFNEGEFHLLGEVITREKKIVGYVKPFLVDADYFGNKREFKNVRHFFAEVGATVSNWILENSDTNTTAAIIPFVFKKGNMDINAGKALWSSIHNGLLEDKRIRPQNDKYNLKQAQEEKK